MKPVVYKETDLSKIFGLALVGAGIYIGIKNHKSLGFWPGVFAVMLIGGCIGIKIYNRE